MMLGKTMLVLSRATIQLHRIIPPPQWQSCLRPYASRPLRTIERQQRRNGMDNINNHKSSTTSSSHNGHQNNKGPSSSSSVLLLPVEDERKKMVPFNASDDDIKHEEAALSEQDQQQQQQLQQPVASNTDRYYRQQRPAIGQRRDRTERILPRPPSSSQQPNNNIQASDLPSPAHVSAMEQNASLRPKASLSNLYSPLERPELIHHHHHNNNNKVNNHQSAARVVDRSWPNNNNSKKKRKKNERGSTMGRDDSARSRTSYSNEKRMNTIRQRERGTTTPAHKQRWPLVGMDEATTINNKMVTLADQLEASGERVPVSCWVYVTNIRAITSLDAVLRGISDGLEQYHQTRGVANLDAVWDPHTDPALPLLADLDDHNDNDNHNNNTSHNHWIEKAVLSLSPFARPVGWYIKLRNRSIVFALLQYAREESVDCGSKKVIIKEYPGDAESILASKQEFLHISDATVRVENCPSDLTEISIRHLFTRYDLTHNFPSVVPWRGMTSDGKVPPNTYLVHFADPSWARAAVRDMQNYLVKDQPLRLVQYPRQLL